MRIDPEPSGPSEPPGTAAALLLGTRSGRLFALPLHTTLELLEHADPLRVPGRAPHALGLVGWRGRRIPLVDADGLLDAAAVPQDAPRYALAVAWQSAPGAAPDYGALVVAGVPEIVRVEDRVACPLPDDGAAWSRFALSCFLRAGRPVPILDTARLFGGCRDDLTSCLPPVRTSP
jgi:chemotaxis signal transduction protein